MGNDYSLGEGVKRPNKNSVQFPWLLRGMRVLPVLCMSFLCSAKEIQVEKLRITNQLPGWTETAETYRLFDAQELFDIINGGAPEYIDHGMKRGITQRLVNTDATNIELFAEDFGTPKKAHIMYMIKKEGNYTVDSDSSVSHGFILNKVIGGFWCFGTLGRFYFEITISGSDDQQIAHETLKTLFAFYRTSIEHKKKPLHE